MLDGRPLQSFRFGERIVLVLARNDDVIMKDYVEFAEYDFEFHC
jgi:hypothetical protein